MFKKSLLISSISLCLASCASAPTAEELVNADYGVPMSQADCEKTVKDFAQYHLKDAASAQYQFGNCTKQWASSAPIFNLPKQYGYLMHVSINAKNSFGGYTGYQQYQFLMKDNRIIRKLQYDNEYNVFIAF